MESQDLNVKIKEEVDENLFDNVTTFDGPAQERISGIVDTQDKSDQSNKVTIKKGNKSICRVCARNQITLININKNPIIRNKLLQCLKINVTKEECLPKMICKKCLALLNLFQDFITMSLESQKVRLTD